ncbi:MAG: hypothetical protein ABFE07_28150 [Armatimonadia bacterium]
MPGPDRQLDQLESMAECFYPLRNLLIEVDKLPAPGDAMYYQILGKIRDQAGVCRSTLIRHKLYEGGLRPSRGDNGQKET